MPPLPLVLLLLLCVGISCGRQHLLNDEKKGEREVRRLTHAVRRASAESAGTRRSGKGPLGSWEVTSDEPMHKVVCDGRPCRPGEGNLRGYEMWKQPYAPLDEKTLQGLSRKPIHGPRGDYYAELVQRGIERAKPGHFIAFAAADFDYRYFALNWHMSAKRAGLGSSAILYALDSPAYDFLAGHLGRAVVNGTATTEMWERTRLMRHIQRALAERHMAAAALVAGGLDVLLCDTSEVFLADPRPALISALHATSADILTARNCGDKTYGCMPRWNFQLFRGGTGRKELVVSFIEAGIDRGMVDFYLRWWTGTHCIFTGYTKSFLDASPQLEDGLTAELMLADRNRTAVFKLTNKKWCPTGANDAAGADSRVCMRIAMLPHNTFPATNNFVEDRAHALIGRLDKPPPTPFHRLRLDRYDEFDLGGLEKRMKEGGLWFLS